MGIGMVVLQKLDACNVFKPNCRVLDIGSTNLYESRADEILGFLKKHNPNARGDLPALAERLAAGSYDVPGRGVTSFLGELLEAAGMTYVSFDIYEGYKTEIIDLNRVDLPPRHRGAFDLVINSGTTEHVFNQINSFKIIHEAAASGGHMFHALPSIGFVDHCYFTYTGRFFFELADFNQYELEDYWMAMGKQLSSVFASADRLKHRFPALERYLQRMEAQGPAALLNLFRCPEISVNVLLRKTKAVPFMASLETSTTGGAVPDHVRGAYVNTAEGFTPAKV
jgi:hypothetical protein